MPVYKSKICKVCGFLFNPSNPNQKYCSPECREKGTKELAKKRDRRRNRKRYGYKKYHRKCEACGREFVTYYSRKRYCGSEECEKERIRRKNKRIYSKLSSEYIRSKYRKYYEKNKELCRLRKAIRYRETHKTDKEYIPRGFHTHTIDYVKSYVEQYGYKLLSEEYVNNKTPIKLLCPEGHEWETTFHSFKDASARCLFCYLENNYTSEPERRVLDYFLQNFPKVNVVHNDRSQIYPRELDLYFPDCNVAVEICGLYWHSEISGCKNRSYHYDKMIACKNKGIRLITVFEDEVRDKFDMVMSRILQALHMVTKRIYARKCRIEKIASKDANAFFRDNHLQGSTQAKVSWGLFFNDELVAVCSLGNFIRKHTRTGNFLELKRYCSKNYTTVVGGFSRLFKRAVEYCRLNNVDGVISYCDMRYANIFGTVYDKLGFKLIRETKYTPHYVRKGKRYRNFSLRKTKEEQVLGMTEFELRKKQGYDRIWDCGHRTYLFEVKNAIT